MPRATSALLFQENIVPGGSQCELEMLLLLLLVHQRRTRTLRVEAPLTPGKGPHHVKLGDCRPPSRGAGREYSPLRGNQKKEKGQAERSSYVLSEHAPSSLVPFRASVGAEARAHGARTAAAGGCARVCADSVSRVDVFAPGGVAFGSHKNPQPAPLLHTL